MRFGRSFDTFYGSLSSIHYPDLTIRLTLTISKITSALYLFADHIIWLSRTGLTRNVNIKKWNDLSNKYWLVSIIMNLVRDIYEIVRLFDSNKRFKTSRSRPASIQVFTSFRSMLYLTLCSYASIIQHKDVAIDTVKNICDLFIPLNSLGYTKFSARTIGVLGAISSVAAIITLIEPSTKLVPM